MRLQGVLQVPAIECERVLAGVVKTIIVPDGLGIRAGRYLLADSQVRGEVALDDPAPPVPARESAALGVTAQVRRQLYPRARALVEVPVLSVARVELADAFTPRADASYCLHTDMEVAAVDDGVVAATDVLLARIAATQPLCEVAWPAQAHRVRRAAAALTEACLPLRSVTAEVPPFSGDTPTAISIVRAAGLVDEADAPLLDELERWLKVAADPALDDGEKQRGMVVSPPWMAQAIVDGLKTLFVKPRAQDLAGTWVVLSARHALGIVDLAAAGVVDRAGLLERAEQTKIDEPILDAWAREYPSWGDGQYWLWRVTVRERFAAPRETDVPLGPQGAVPEVTVLDAITKMHVADINPQSLRRVDDAEVRATNLRLHQLYGALFADNDRMSAGGLQRELLVNAYVFLRDEMRRRGFAVTGDTALDQAAERLVQQRLAPHALVRPGKDGADLPPISLAEVLPHLQSFKMRMPFLYMVGGLPSHGETTNDIDLVVRGPIDEDMLHVLRFRLGRMLPPELSARMQLHGDDLGGPFTNHIELADLVVQFRPSFDVKEMMIKADDPNLDLPKAAGPHDAVLQYHFRGASVHGDLRLKVGDYLVGWTLALARAGAVPDVQGDMARAKQIAEAFDVRGGRYNKPLEAPARIYAVPKERQPTPWLRFERAFPPGAAGASAEMTGVMVIVAKPQVQWGLQSPRFHEYFLTGAGKLAGLLTLRQIVSNGSEQVPRGEPFWTAQLSKIALPSVLRRHAVTEGTMPEPGRSALPVSLERATPREFRYWEETGAKARAMRDALVAAHFFTESNVAVVDGEFVRLEQKAFIYAGDGADVKRAAMRRFVLAWQTWKGQQVERFGPTRQVYHLLIEDDGHVRDFILQADPLSGESAISATVRQVGRELLEIEGDLEPGKSYGGVVLNDTEATPSRWDVVDAGSVIATDVGGAVQLEVRGRRLRGRFEIVPEGGDTGLWTFAPLAKREEGEPLLRAIPERDGVQIWDPERKDPDADRSALRPLAIFQPMKPRDRLPDVDAVVGTLATPAALQSGIYVEPKWNGFRFVVERSGDRLIGYTEDRKVDLLPHLPGLEAELRRIDGDWILDAEFMAINAEGQLVPRADLAEYRGEGTIDDASVRLHVFDVLYWRGRNLTAEHYDKRRAVLEHNVFDGKDARGDRLLLSPKRLVHTAAELRDAYAWASKQDGSEGAMFKLAPSTYTLGGTTDSWQKVREVRQIIALVYDRQPVKDNPNAWVLLGAVGPIPADEMEKWKETIEWKGKRYVALGHTFSSAVDAPPGAIVSVAATELFYNPQDGVLHWFQPSVTVRVRQTFPMTVDQVIALVQPEEVRAEAEVAKALAFLSTASERTVALVKSTEERMVYGIVLEPETVDAQGDIYDAATIRQAAHIFMEKFGGLGLMHRYIINGQARILETWIAPCDLDLNGTTVKKGTWLLAVRVIDDELWDAVKAGKFTGFSIGGSARRIAARANN